MTRFELKTTGVGSDCSDNYSSACAKLFSPITLKNLIAYKIAQKLFVSKHLLEFEIYSGIANGTYNLKNGFKRYFREKSVQRTGFQEKVPQRMGIQPTIQQIG